MKLIDADGLLKKQYCIDDSATLSTRDVVNVEDIEDAPSIMAVLIDNIKSAIEAEKERLMSNGCKEMSKGIEIAQDIILKCIGDEE